MKRFAPLLILAALTLAACGEKEDTTAVGTAEPVDLMLDYFPNADHVGIYAAIENEDFTDAGLNVRPRTPSDPAAPLKLLQAGRVDLAISYEPELLLARDKGADLVAVGALVQKPLTSIVSLGSERIRSPRDLEGKRVATSGIPYQSAYLKTILEGASIASDEVKETNVGFNLVPALLSKKADAALGAFWNYEGVDLEQRGRKPNIIRMEDAGVPTYNELVIVARREDVRSRGSMIRRFMQALTRGHNAVKADPDAAVGALLKANRDLERKLQRAAVKATLPVFFPTGDRPFGHMDPQEWQDYGEWMLRNELVRRPPNAARALTNEFLPGEGI